MLDARAPHMDTGLAGRAVWGDPPPMPSGADIDSVLASVLDGLERGSAVIEADPRDGTVSTR